MILYSSSVTNFMDDIENEKIAFILENMKKSELYEGTTNAEKHSWENSLKYYGEVKRIYDRMLTPTDSLYASYYNNLSLLYQEMGDFEKAAQCLKTALVIIEAYGDIIKVAITCSNLAASLLRIGAQQEAEFYLDRAICTTAKKISAFLLGLFVYACY